MSQSDLRTDRREAGPDKKGPENVDYSLIDQTLWTAFRDAAGGPASLAAWLAIQCRQLPGVQAAVLTLGPPGTGPYAPVAEWPVPGSLTPALAQALDDATLQRQPVLAAAVLALPVEVEGALFGAIAVALPPTLPPTEALRHLRWGQGWLEALLLREQGLGDAALRDRTSAALDTVGTLLVHRRFDRAARALVTELARKLDCDLVALGRIRRRHAKVRALSGAASFGKRMSLVRNLERAMDEAADQRDLVLWPPGPGWDYRVSRMNEELVRDWRAGSVLTIPLQSDGAITGALCFLRPEGRPFSDEDIALADTMAALAGPVLERIWRSDRPFPLAIAMATGDLLARLFGPRHAVLKLSVLVLAGLLWAGLTVTAPFTIPAPARVEGAIQRSVVAPFDSYLASQSVRAGDRVSEGEMLAKLDDRDLTLEELRWTTTISQRETEYARALADRDRAEASIIQSQLAQAQAQLALIRAQLDRTRIIAPFDGLVVSGDLSQSVGTALRRGEELFRIAPLDDWRVVLQVDENDIGEVTAGQTGRLRLSSRPEAPLGFEITQITPVAKAEGGRNAFRVEARLTDAPDWLRPAMEGVARVSIDERLIADIWTRRARARIALMIWGYAG